MRAAEFTEPDPIIQGILNQTQWGKSNTLLVEGFARHMPTTYACSYLMGTTINGCPDKQSSFRRIFLGQLLILNFEWVKIENSMSSVPALFHFFQFLFNEILFRANIY